MKENTCFELYKILFYNRKLYICENCTNLPILVFNYNIDHPRI